MKSAVATNEALVDPAWLAAHLDDPDVRVIEIAGLGQEERKQAYADGHIPGAECWEWKSTLWDSHTRDFPDPDDFARRLGEAGIGNDTTVVFYGEPVQFGIYAWWTFVYCGHRNVKVLERFSFVEVPADRAQVVAEAVSGKQARGAKLLVEVAKKA